MNDFLMNNACLPIKVRPVIAATQNSKVDLFNRLIV